MSEMTEFSFHTDPKTVQVAGRRRVLRIFVALAIVALGAVVGIVLVISAPRTAKRPPTKWVPLVEVQTLEPQPRQVTVTAMGTVMPARTVSLKARVAGQVKALHPEFTEGGFVTEGDLLIQLDDADYRLALVQRKSDLVNAGYALALEQGRQQVAKREWALLNNGVEEESDADLALRKPHLEKARADVTAAEAALAKAQLDMARTRIQAPFNALVRSRTVAVGSQVSPQEPLAELVGTDVYWVQATLPVERLDWMTIPAHGGQRGSSAVVQYGAGHEVQGRVVRLLGDLTSGGRMAKVLVAVADPLGP
ncbi:MAG: efflux RND transporter periplasmic adaptor subunit, partial [Desulfatitalea sp.]|nr:efflux RND transporter periplasmic adaptor subunit [Desulfatitalea sp.]NNK01020.1 efflux RND transporter periplasmic adaptor subunit [Desulfatitalea sp.]